MSSNPPIVVQALCAVAPKPKTSTPLDGPKGKLNLENSEGAIPRRSLRRRGKVEDLGTFSLKLTDHEITEDIFSMTGELPRGHPRRRPVQMQMILNKLVPGAPLAGMTPESYPMHQKKN
ncbi:hypothetical protein BDA96_09G061800 [Sorghum bicolor]|uniref:Uncharacterized protein n=2 Tax=Sorghum bicolor TaxID=4558 RepID=A0A921QA37_SORBI|nr:hypothetical protein BDA96_09G061800 [Sorghum bicolor]KXG21411.1 hypothetical protein SORBI_3009G058300 [Sorghum bicolor]